MSESNDAKSIFVSIEFAFHFPPKTKKKKLMQKEKNKE